MFTCPFAFLSFFLHTQIVVLIVAIDPSMVATNMNSSFTACWSLKKSGAFVTVCTDCIVVTDVIIDGDGIGTVMSNVLPVDISMVSTANVKIIW